MLGCRRRNRTKSEVGVWSDAGLLSRKMVHIESSDARNNLRVGKRSGFGPIFTKWSCRQLRNLEPERGDLPLS